MFSRVISTAEEFLGDYSSIIGNGCAEMSSSVVGDVRGRDACGVWIGHQN